MTLLLLPSLQPEWSGWPVRAAATLHHRAKEAPSPGGEETEGGDLTVSGGVWTGHYKISLWLTYI